MDLALCGGASPYHLLATLLSACGQEGSSSALSTGTNIILISTPLLPRLQERDFRRGVCRQGRGRRLFGEDLAEVIMGLAEGPDVGEVRVVTQCSSHLTVCRQGPGREDACEDRKEDPRTALRCQGWGRGRCGSWGRFTGPEPGRGGAGVREGLARSGPQIGAWNKASAAAVGVEAASGTSEASSLTHGALWMRTGQELLSSPESRGDAFPCRPLARLPGNQGFPVHAHADSERRGTR